MIRRLFDEEHEMFAASVATFVEREVVPYLDDWSRAGIIDRDLYRKAGDAGFLCMAAPEEYGGAGVGDFRFSAVITETLCAMDALVVCLNFSLHNDLVLPYILAANEEQRARWLPKMVSGESVVAIAMTEPGTGSDLAGIRTTAVRDGSEYVINGAKTFISSGFNADLVIVVATTAPEERHAGISLFVVETDRPGFSRGRNLEKLGLHAQDTAELFFDDVRVPVENRLGEEGSGFAQLMRNLAQERLGCSVTAVAHAEAAFGWTLEYVKERTAFGRSIGSFQNSRFKMAEMRTELDLTRAYIDQQVLAHNAGELTAEDAAAGKWWSTDLQVRVMDRCLQLHGGYGYMTEYPISRAYADARIQPIYAGTNEIMKEIVGRSLGL